MAFPYNDLGVGTRHCRLLLEKSQDTSLPFPYPKTINGVIGVTIAPLIVGNIQQLTVNYQHHLTVQPEMILLLDRDLCAHSFKLFLDFFSSILSNSFLNCFRCGFY